MATMQVHKRNTVQRTFDWFMPAAFGFPHCSGFNRDSQLLDTCKDSQLLKELSKVHKSGKSVLNKRP